MAVGQEGYSIDPGVQILRVGILKHTMGEAPVPSGLREKEIERWQAAIRRGEGPPVPIQSYQNAYIVAAKDWPLVEAYKAEGYEHVDARLPGEEAEDFSLVTGREKVETFFLPEE